MTALPERVHPAQVPYVDVGDLVTAKDVVRLARVSYRQLDYWCRIALIQEAIPANGSGTMRFFDPDEVRVAAVFGQLGRNGFGGQQGGYGRLGARIADHVRERGLVGAVRSEDGLVVVDLTAIPDPFEVRATLKGAK